MSIVIEIQRHPLPEVVILYNGRLSCYTMESWRDLDQYIGNLRDHGHTVEVIERPGLYPFIPPWSPEMDELEQSAPGTLARKTA